MRAPDSELQSGNVSCLQRELRWEFMLYLAVLVFFAATFAAGVSWAIGFPDFAGAVKNVGEAARNFCYEPGSGH